MHIPTMDSILIQVDRSLRGLAPTPRPFDGARNPRSAHLEFGDLRIARNSLVPAGRTILAGEHMHQLKGFHLSYLAPRRNFL